LVFDQQGNLYGPLDNAAASDYGAIFKLAPLRAALGRRVWSTTLALAPTEDFRKARLSSESPVTCMARPSAEERRRSFE